MFKTGLEVIMSRLYRLDETLQRLLNKIDSLEARIEKIEQGNKDEQ